MCLNVILRRIDIISKRALMFIKKYLTRSSDIVQHVAGVYHGHMATVIG